MPNGNWGYWLQFVDGGWFDIVTFVVALALAIAKCIYHKHGFLTRETRANIIHGLALFPLFMLVMSIFSKEALQSVLGANRLIIGVAGAVALFSILEDEFDRDDEDL